MATRDPRIDRYIASSPEYARPILEHLRAVVHEACPAVEETMKWSRPHFMYEGMLCGMSAFKEHCAFGFWKGALIVEQGAMSRDAMGQFGRIASVKDLPPKKVLSGYVKAAMRLNEQGESAPPRPKRGPAPPIPVPAELAVALKKNAKAAATFEAFSPSHRREYLEWITEAKTAPTRERRIATTLEWLVEGKSRNWKYERKR